MIAFWVTAVALMLAVVLALVVPLVSRGRVQAQTDGEQDASNVALYRDQLRELERDRDQGLLTPEHFVEARHELGQRLLVDVPDTKPFEAGAGADRFGRWRFLAVGCVPICAVLAYLVIGMPQALDPALVARAPESSADQARNLEQLTQRLATRLEANPQDAEAWVLLARSYQMLGRMPEAMKTFARAIELVPNSAQLYADYADVQVASANGQWTSGASQAVAKALALEPTHPKAMWLAGSEAYARKDFTSALAYWEKLLPMAEPGSDVARMIQGNIAEVRALIGTGPPSSAAKTASAVPAAVAAAPAAKTAATAGALSGTVILDPAIAAKLQGAETVFVFARAAQGPKMPLAIRRIRVQDLPYRFSLDDSAAMAPGMVISAFDQVVVGARISRTGNATPTPGDFEGYAAPVKPGTSGIEVRISAEVR